MDRVNVPALTAMTEAVDLQAYFERIRWRGPVAPDYATLAGLLLAHTARIPFENFDVLLGRPIRLDLPALSAKLVQTRRGGYCFEHTTLFAAVLEAVGFAPVRHSARVTLFLPRSEAPRTHMFLTVPVDGARYVVDPGFGFFGSRVPVPLDGRLVPAGAPTHRLGRDGALWVLFATRDGAACPAWASTLDADIPVDFEMANLFTYAHPASPFVNRIMASALTPEGRVNIMNRSVTFLRGGMAEVSELRDRAALRAMLALHFGFDLPDVETMLVPAVPEWGSPHPDSLP